MKQTLILLFYISLALVTSSLVAQEAQKTQNDTLSPKHKYGLRVGADISKPLRTLFEKGYTGFEIMGDFRFSKKFYLAAEIGSETKDWTEPNLTNTTTGSYVKIGVDYNAYNNWLDMNNAIFAGLRYGFSTFKQELTGYSIYTTTHDFPSPFIETAKEFSGLNAHWIELIVGVKTEIFNNLFLSVNLQLKLNLSSTQPENFANLYIPGFNKTNDFSDFGVGYGYTISYLIPIFKK